MKFLLRGQFSILALLKSVILTLFKVLETILKELRDPDRNMHNFDPGPIHSLPILLFENSNEKNENLNDILKENERGNFLLL